MFENTLLESTEKNLIEDFFTYNTYKSLLEEYRFKFIEKSKNEEYFLELIYVEYNELKRNRVIRQILERYQIVTVKRMDVEHQAEIKKKYGRLRSDDKCLRQATLAQFRRNFIHDVKGLAAVLTGNAGICTKRQFSC